MKPAYLLLFTFFLLTCKSVDKQVDNTKRQWAMLNFIKVDSLNPILKTSPDSYFNCPISKKSIKWEERNVLNPSAVVKDGKVFLIYRAQDQDMTSRLGLATSEDGLHFTKQTEPILFPAEDSLKKYE